MYYKLSKELMLIPLSPEPFHGSLDIEIDLPSNVILQATISAEGMKVHSFLQQIKDQHFHTKFVLPEEFLSKKEIYLNVSLFNQLEWIAGPKIALPIDRNRIRAKIKERDYFKDVEKQIADINFRLNTYASGFVKPTLPTFNADILEKGMVFAVIDEEGNCAFIHPYFGVVKSINNVKPEDNNVTLTAEDIEYRKDLTLAGAIKIISAGQKALSESNQKINKTLKTLIEDLSKLRIEFDEYKNRDIF